MTERRPAVSVVIPCYQQAEYLAEAVESVVGQDFGDWEIVIVDDGSTDATAETAGALIAAHPDRPIRLLRQANQGLSAARNHGISGCVGQYVLPLDADDILLPGFLRRTVELLETEPGIAIAYTDQRHFGAVEKEVDTADWDTDLLRRRNLFAVTALYRREVWLAVGGYNPNMSWGYEDWDFWLAAAERGFVGRRIPEPLLGYRIKPASMLQQARKIHHRELIAQLRVNHPETYRQPWRQWRRWPGRLLRRVRHLMKLDTRGAPR